MNIKPGPATVLIGILLALCILYGLDRYLTLSEVAHENAHEPMKIIFPDRDISIHCTDVLSETGDAISECLQSYQQEAATKDLIVWIGNSQLHTINRYSQGEEVAPALLHDLRKAHEEFVLTISLPNLSMQETLYTVEKLIPQVSMKTLMIPVVFDDYREDGVRHGLMRSFAEELPDIGEKVRREVTGETTATFLSLQERSEAALDDIFERKFFLWRRRSDFRELFYFGLYHFRNYIFSIDPTTKRAQIPVFYKKNMDAFEKLLDVAQKQSIKTIVYIAPIRSDLELPYYPEEYRKFKKSIEDLCRDYGAAYYNFELLVPHLQWGMKTDAMGIKSSEIDFMHFTYSGHLLLSKELNDVLHSLREDN